MFNTLKKTSLALLVVSTALFQFSCKDKDAEADKVGNWYRQGIPDFGGTPRSGTVSFVIGDKGYIGTGRTNETISRVKDMWSFTGKSWSQVADFPGTGRQDAISFVVGSKAYVGTGYDGNTLVDNGYKKDFYEYDPATNKWKQIADFPMLRSNASSFVLGNKGYVGLGSINITTMYQDFYSYDPANNTWSSSVANFTGGKRKGANAFVLGGKAYVGFGQNNSQVPTKDLYQFDPAANSWTRLESTNDNLTARAFGFTLVMNEKAYIIGGSGVSDVWQYDAGTNTWVAMTPFENGARSYAAGFTLKDATGKEIGYLGTGLAGGSQNTDDLWAFDPAAAVNADDN